MSNNIVIGTYNMSFFSDKNDDESDPCLQYPSELTFLERNKYIREGSPRNTIYGDRRQYWINSLNKLRDFIVEKRPGAIGLQEMNKTGTSGNQDWYSQ